MRLLQYTYTLTAVALFALDLVAADSLSLKIEPYAQAGVAEFQQQQGSYQSIAYMVGCNLEVSKLFGLDVGFLDYGTIQTESIPLYGIPEIVPDAGQTTSRQALFLLGTVSFRPTSRISLSVSLGPALFDTRVRSYSHYVSYPDVLEFAADKQKLGVIYKGNVSYRIAPEWTLEGSISYAKSWGFSVARYRRNDSFHIAATTATVGLSYTPNTNSRQCGNPDWQFSLGPAIASIQFHKRFRSTALGYDLAISRKLGETISVVIGQMNMGVTRYSTAGQIGAFLLKSSFQYSLISMKHEITSRCAISTAAGAGYVSVSAFWEGPANMPIVPTYSSLAHRTSLLAQIGISSRISQNCAIALNLRYANLHSPITTLSGSPNPERTSRIDVISIQPNICIKF